MKVSLVVMNPGKTAGHAIPITLSQFIIGRDPQCNLRPASPVISKRHCAILIKNGRVTIRDFESTNGTFINEVPVKGEMPLNHDNILKVGPLTFKVVIENAVGVDKPTPPPKKNPGNDEDVANMLLALQENDEETAGTASAHDEVPGGSTVMDMKGLPSLTTLAEAQQQRSVTPPPRTATPPAKSPAPPVKSPPPPVKSATPPPPTVEVKAEEPTRKPEEKKPDDKKAPQHGSARDAAKAILDKYVKRNRSTGK